MANLAKYLKLRQYMADMMLRHTSEDIPLMSERDMCKSFNVTRTTVRKALKIFISEGSIITKRGSGMYLKGCIRRNTYHLHHPPSKILYIHGGGRNVFYDSWSLHVLEEVCKFAKRNNFMMQFSSLIGEVGMEMEELEMYSPEAILWVRPTQTVRPLIPEIRKKIPVCVIADSVRNDSFAVTSDYYQAGAKAAEYFICNGFRNILYACRMNTPDSITGAFREGWCSTIQRRMPSVSTVYLHQESDFQQVLNALPARNFDAVFTHSAYYPGIDALLKATNRSDCPIMVDSFDYVRFPDSIPPRWVIDLYPEVIFETAVNNVCRALHEPHYEQKEIVFQAEIIEQK